MKLKNTVKIKSYISDKLILSFCLTVILCTILTSIGNAQVPYLKRQIESIHQINMEFSTSTSSYKPIFGVGDANQSVSKGVKHYGLLSINPGGNSKRIKFNREELVYYVLDGTGMLDYGGTEVPISKNDFFYLPINMEHGFSNSREDTLNIMLMGFEVAIKTEIKPTSILNIANADKVESQLLPQNNHGPSSRFQLLMGATNSKRDRLTSAYQVNSLYIIDFDYGGTNIPHRHKAEDEIYLLLQGNGEMVVGENSEGKEIRSSAKPGDAFFFPPNTLVGFYSTSDTTQNRAKILAIRSKVLIK